MPDERIVWESRGEKGKVDGAVDLPSLQRFARHLERDLDAVTAGLSQPWSSGVVEGHVNRIIMWNLI